MNQSINATDNLKTFIIRRVLIAVIVFFLLTLLIFFLFQVYPDIGEPRILFWNGVLSQEEIKHIYHELGWDKGLIEKYFDWIGRIFTGDWGTRLGNY